MPTFCPIPLHHPRRCTPCRSGFSHSRAHGRRQSERETCEKHPLPHFSLPHRPQPSQDRHLLQILCKKRRFRPRFRGQKRAKNSPPGLFRRPLSPKTGEKRAENHKQALRIVHFVVFLTSWLPTDATISRRKTQNQHFSARLFRRCKSNTDGYLRHNTHKSTLRNEEIRKNSAFL